MARLDEVSSLSQNEVPFPQKMNGTIGRVLGKGIEFPKKFLPIVNSVKTSLY